MSPTVAPTAGVDPNQFACATNVVRDILQQLGPSPTGGIIYIDVALAAR
jgi:hypothetical protein